MDVQLLRIYDKAQDADALYREVLRNCKNEDWYNRTPYFTRIDHLILTEKFDCFEAHTHNENWWMLEKWINLT